MSRPSSLEGPCFMIPPATVPPNFLPEGVVLVDFRPATGEDFEIVNEQDIHSNWVKRIHQGPRAGAASGVIVEPAPGYSFRYNVRTFSYDIVKSLGHFEGEKWIAEPE